VTAAPAVELLPAWQDPLTVALPATHPLAAQPAVRLAQLGFEPLPGPPFTTPQDTLAETGAGPPAWTVLYTAATDLMPVRRVAFRPLAGLTVQTCLAVPPARPPRPSGACSTPVHQLTRTAQREQ
jgi:hypothetical protein